MKTKKKILFFGLLIGIFLIGTVSACEHDIGYVASAAVCYSSCLSWEASQASVGTCLYQGSPYQFSGLGYCKCNFYCGSEGLTAQTYYKDSDGDGYYPSGGIINARVRDYCLYDSGGWGTAVKTAGDCNDANAAIKPSATEICGNSVDENCDGIIASCACTRYNWYLDADNDGYYPSGGLVNQCTAPAAGWTKTVKTAGDCNDANAAIKPSATEICNGVDDNCVNGIDEGSTICGATQTCVAGACKIKCSSSTCASLTPAYTNCQSANYCGALNTLGLKIRDATCTDHPDLRFICYNGVFYGCAASWNAGWTFATQAADKQGVGTYTCNKTYSTWMLPTAVCNDGTIIAPETCEDGNLLGGDGCNAQCQTESGWSCSGTPSVCNAICGDGIIVGAENCDDNNAANSDGCNTQCQIESGWKCEINSSGSSVCTQNLATCGGTLPEGASWTSTNYPGYFNKTWNATLNAWTPDSKSVSFNQLPGECYFDCDPQSWDSITEKCVSTDAQFCSDLKTQILCAGVGGNSQIAINSAPAQACDDPLTICVCSWNSMTSTCEPGFDELGTINNLEEITQTDCIWTVSLQNNCGKTLNNIIATYTATWQGEGAAPLSCKNNARQYSCGEIAQLGFFENIQFILCLLVIAFVYFILVVRKKI